MVMSARQVGYTWKPKQKNPNPNSKMYQRFQQKQNQTGNLKKEKLEGEKSTKTLS